MAGQIDLFRVARQVLPGPVKLHVCPTHNVQQRMHYRHLTLPAAWEQHDRRESSHHMCLVMPLHFSHAFPPSVLQTLFQCYALQYTFILTASKQLPKQCTDYQSGKSKQRKSVGVRIPDDTVLQVSICVTTHVTMTSHANKALCMRCCTLAVLTELGHPGLDMLLQCDRRGLITNGLPMLPGVKSTSANHWSQLQTTWCKLQLTVRAFIKLRVALLAGSA